MWDVYCHSADLFSLALLNRRAERQGGTGPSATLSNLASSQFVARTLKWVKWFHMAPVLLCRHDVRLIWALQQPKSESLCTAGLAEFRTWQAQVSWSR